MRLFAGGVVVAFLLGVVASWMLLGARAPSLGELLTLRRATPVQQAAPPATAPAPDSAPAAAVTPTPTASAPEAAVAQEARQTAQKVAQVAEQTGGIDQRVAALEQRITRLDLQSQAAAGNAARAEGLLITFAARRAIERGVPLDYLADQLRLRFGDSKPNAVQTVIDEARDPVTLDQLMTRLEGIAPQLTQTPRSAGLLTRIGNELSQIFVIRTADSPSPVPEQRLERARTYLETGRVEYAVTEVRHMPNAGAAADWIRDAERYAAAQRALDVLEAAAILGPRDLNDGSGNKVQQPSPATTQPQAG